MSDLPNYPISKV